MEWRCKRWWTPFFRMALVLIEPGNDAELRIECFRGYELLLTSGDYFCAFQLYSRCLLWW
jgi:hypothetical protein